MNFTEVKLQAFTIEGFSICKIMRERRAEGKEKGEGRRETFFTF
jgi:hypothetical protein